MSKRIRFGLVFAALVPLVFGACSVSPGDKVTITMTDNSLDVSPSRVRSGRVRLAIDSVGEMTHDLALMLAKDVSALARTPEGKLDLQGANRPIDEIESFEPGHYIATTPNLLAGRYLVVCTIHVDQGLVGKLTVVPRKRQVQ